MLSTEIELQIQALTNQDLLEWGRHRPGADWTTDRERDRDRAAARKRMARRIGEHRPRVPLEQLDLLGQWRRSDLAAMDALGTVGDALEHLAERYLDLRDGHPVPRSERLLELQRIRCRVMVEQLACWRVARELHRRDPYFQHMPRFDWPAGLSLPDPYLERGLVEDGPLVDGHVHLGGVLGTLDLWREILDPWNELHHAWSNPGVSQELGIDRLTPTTRFRLSQARTIRDLIAIELVNSARARFFRLYPSWHPDRPLSRASGALGPVTRAMFERLRKEAASRFQRELMLERSLARTPTSPGMALGLSLSRLQPVPLILSPWFRESLPEETGDGFVRRERELLVHSFLALMANPQGLALWFGPLLASYLVCQNVFHHTVTQQGERAGLENFLQWYDSPTRSLETREQRGRRARTLARVSMQGKIRVEGRIVPRAETISSWIETFREHRKKGQRLGRDFGLVLHFIKQREEQEADGDAQGEPFDHVTMASLRHRRLREKCRDQALTLEELRALHPEVAQAVLGIDAARKETDVPPEVFAAVYRFLRRPQVPGSQFHTSDPSGWVPSLRATYHVGESFHHPISGLRAIHEAILFLALGAGDRLGHGIALGLDQERWDRYCGSPTYLTREERFDNLVWIHWMMRGTPEYALISPNLQERVSREFEQLYPQAPAPRPHELLEILGWAWRLRWMDPDHLFGVLANMGWSWGRPHPRCEAAANGRQNTDRESEFRGYLKGCEEEGRCLVSGRTRDASDPKRSCRARGRAFCHAVRDVTLSERHLIWRLCALDLEQLLAGEVPKASLRVLWLYHYDKGYRQRGTERVAWDDAGIPMVRVFQSIRARLLSLIDQRRITVEVCPSSNVAIGPFESIAEHPVLEFDTTHLESTAAHPLRVSVNTDDPGIFSTNLPNEYALLARAAREKNEGAQAVSDWLRHLRRQSRTASFLRLEGMEQDEEGQEASWPPALALHPEWARSRWRDFALDTGQHRTDARHLRLLRKALLSDSGTPFEP